MTSTAVSPRFRKMVDDSLNGLVLKPKVDAYMINSKFPERFVVTFRKAGEARKPDGWFHPSTHPGWTQRQLYYYLTEPDRVEAEVLAYESRMAVTMGTAVHAFIETCIRDMGAMAPLEGTCVACGRPHGTKRGECDEYGACDPEIGSRGHMDGVLAIDRPGVHWQPGLGGFEFKTSNDRKVANVKNNDLDAFRAKWPEYYDQVQNYMEITGLRQFLVLFAVLGYPWRMVEFQIPYDPLRGWEIRNKYRQVRENVERGTVPDACCGPGSKEAKACPVRSACPIGRLGR